jgi:signal transduction histidine kinase
LYVLSLAVVVPAMVWLTVKAHQLDRAEAAARREVETARAQAVEARTREELARRRAELEEDVSLALWRMDTWLAPLIAQEATWPYYAYRSFYDVPPSGKVGKGVVVSDGQLVSPLLNQPSEYVLLHFQVSPDNSVSSPQAPPEHLNPKALDNGTTMASIQTSNYRLVQLKEQVDHERLWSQLPEQSLPSVEIKDFAWNTVWNPPLNSPNQGPNFANVNDLGFPQLQRQFDQQETTQQRTQQAQPAPQQAPNPPPDDLQQRQLEGQFQLAQRYDVSRDPQTQMMRGNNEFLRRNRAVQNVAQQALTQKWQGLPEVFKTTMVNEGVSRPLWIGRHLVLARRVTVGEKQLVQGAWLDWDAIRSALLDETADLLPGADLIPVQGDAEVNPARMLATLPVRLLVPDPVVPAVTIAAATEPPVSRVSPIQVSLWIAWACMILAALAVAILLTGVVSLSERRAAFVASVTHELRTPLTTFRMYAEMLAEGMLPDEAKRQSYLNTLRAEAERLTHLVSNVLAYARLERGRPGARREDVSLGQLVDRVLTRLTERAEQAEMELLVQRDPDVVDRQVRTDPAAVEQVLFNLVDNACKYASASEDKRIHLTLAAADGSAELRVRDHGPGISAKARRRLFVPFSKSVHDAANTAPGVGLGLALCRRLARDLGGRLDIESNDEDGASFVLQLPLALRQYGSFLGIVNRRR